MTAILIIEDDPSIRENMAEILEYEGYSVLQAENGLVGVEVARNALPDLILCDVMMPKMDGYGVLSALRGQPATRHIPFVFLTAKADRFWVRQGMDLGADDYLTKPYTLPELLAVVRTRLEKRDSTPKVPLRNAQGSGAEIVDISQNVTAYQQADEGLQQERNQQAAQAQVHEDMRQFLQSTLDAFPANTVVLESDGTILLVNKRWKQFADENGGLSPTHYEGTNYLSVCAASVGPMSEEKTQAAAGICAVIEGRQDEFYLEYSCHSPSEQRWFGMRVSPFSEAVPRRVVVAHINITERKQAEEALQHERNTLRTLIDTVPANVFIRDAQDRFVDANLETIRKFGVTTRADLLGKTDFDFFSPELAAKYFADDQGVLQSGQPLLNLEELTVDQRTQEPLWFLTTKAPIRNEHGEVTGLVGIGLDITERKRAEQALQAKGEEEQRFQSALKALYEITIELTQIDSLDDFYRRVVELALERLGFDRFAVLLYDAEHSRLVGTYGTDAHGKLVAEHQLQFDPAALTDVMKRTLETDERFVINEHAQLFSNLEPIGFGWNAIALLQNGAQSLGWLAADNAVQHQPVSKTLLDILSLYAQTVGTLLGRKRAEQALRANEAKLQTFFEMLPIGVSVLNRPGQIVEMNPALARILGLSREELLSGDYRSRKYVFSDGRPMQHSDLPVVRAFVEQQAVHDVVVGVIKEDETTVWTSVSAVPLPSTQSGVMMVTTDITERKRAEAQAFELVAEQQRGRLMREFITSVSHDFRTPLTIMGTSAFLVAKTSDPAKLTQHSQRIEEQISRLRLLLDNFVELADLEQQASSFPFQSTDLDALVRTLLEQRQREVVEKQQQLEYRCETHSTRVLGEPTVLTKAVANLLTNALHYTPAEGEIRLRLYSEGDHAILEVADSGIGIPASDLPHIFESFYRVDSARSTTTGGAGLGLSIAKRIVELLKGRIEVASEFGVGSVFKIYLPLG